MALRLKFCWLSEGVNPISLKIMEHEIATEKCGNDLITSKNNWYLNSRKISSHHISVLRISGKAEGQFQDVVSTVGFISVLAQTPGDKVTSGQIPASPPALLVLRNVLKMRTAEGPHTKRKCKLSNRGRIFLILPKIVPGEARFQDSGASAWTVTLKD